jgi:hypothetical protein
VFGLTLDRVELSFRILRPVYRKTITYKPFCEIGSINRTCRVRFASIRTAPALVTKL